MARRFGQSDVARHDGLVDLVAEVPADLADHVFRQASALVEHGQYDAGYLQARVERLPDALQRGQQLADAFERKVLTLQGDQDAVGRRRARRGEMAERGRAVEEHQVVGSHTGSSAVAQPPLPAGLAHELDLDADQVAVGGDDVEAWKAGWANAVRERGLAAQDLVEQRRRRP